MKKTYLLAGPSRSVGLWMGSGLPVPRSPRNQALPSAPDSSLLVDVTARTTAKRRPIKHGRFRSRKLVIKESHGSGTPDGLIDARPVERGDFVEAGDLFVKFHRGQASAFGVEQAGQHEALYTM